MDRDVPHRYKTAHQVVADKPYFRTSEVLSIFARILDFLFDFVMTECSRTMELMLRCRF